MLHISIRKADGADQASRLELDERGPVLSERRRWPMDQKQVEVARVERRDVPRDVSDELS